jgi:serine/threonine-protein kinase
MMSAWAVGEEIGPYLLLATIGRGGMGDVWQARDTRLDRLVAVKRVRSMSPAFEHEARAIAALNHPNICTLHDVGSDYLVMEFVQGAPVTGPLEAREAIRLAVEILKALEAAHHKGIVHCDLKPANVFVADGRVKLLDFGIARLIADPDTTQMPQDGVAGTPAYMSPEQARGERADVRSDIFSFGVLLYEMLSGQRAFHRSSIAATISAVLTDDPAPIPAPAGVLQILNRCLEKSPTQRFQTVAEVRAALERLSSRAQNKPSIAVLPFANLSSDPEQDYFSDGLTDEIITALARVPGLKVIARTSAFAFKGQNVAIAQIADALGVETVLEGSVRRVANRLRVTAQLISVGDGCQLWSQRYDRELSDVFAVQDDIASAIVVELRGQLTIPVPVARAHTPRMPAYEAYLMGRHHVWQFGADQLRRGQKKYEEAIGLDPSFALPYVGLAELAHIQGSTIDAGAAPRIRSAAARAIELDSSLAEGHAWLGIVASTYEYRWQEAERHFARAVALAGTTPRIRHLHGYFYLRFVGRANQAVTEHQLALHDDPLNFIVRVGLCTSLTSAGRHGEALAEARRLLELAPAFTPAYRLLPFDVAAAPLPEALAYAERNHSLAPLSPGPSGLLAGLLERDGQTERAQSVLRAVVGRDAYGSALDWALYHLARGKADAAFEFLEELRVQRHPFLLMTLVGGPYAPVLRASAHWPVFARSIGLMSIASTT